MNKFLIKIYKIIRENKKMNFPILSEIAKSNPTCTRVKETESKINVSPPPQQKHFIMYTN